MLRSIGLALLVIPLLTQTGLAAGKNYALLVGVQKYEDHKLEPLEFADRDVTALATLLERAGYHITLLADSPGQNDKLLLPTKDNFDRSLDTVLGKLQKDDLLLVVFVGRALKFVGKPENYLCPRDGKPLAQSSQSLVSLELLCDKLGNCRASGKILLADVAQPLPQNANATGIEVETVKLRSGVHALFSCSQGERPLVNKDVEQGVFFQQVRLGLGGKAGDGNDDITFASLAKFVCKEVPLAAKALMEDAKQTPVVLVGASSSLSPLLARHPDAIPQDEWKEYEGVWSKGSTEPFLKKYAPTRFAAWRKSAEAGSARGMMLLADCTEFGIGGPKDPKTAARWYGQGAKRGNSFAMVGFGLCYRKGFGVEKDTQEAANWFRKSAECGDTSGMYLLAGCYSVGSGVAKDQKEAAKWYRKSAEQGSGPASYSLALCYLEGEGVEKNPQEAVRWFRAGADLENTDCMVYLGICYQKGTGVEKNANEAVRWFRTSADLGDSSGMDFLAMCYSRGLGVPKDQKEAIRWYRKSAELGSTEAMLSLALSYLDGTGVNQDEKEAIRWLRKGSARGNPYCMIYLGICYRDGVGVGESDKDAFNWFRKAADIGNAEAMNLVARCYIEGTGVDPDEKEGAKWYKKSAELDNVPGMVNLAICYLEGTGVEKSRAEARRWLRRAADQGDDKAKELLKSLSD